MHIYIYIYIGINMYLYVYTLYTYTWYMGPYGDMKLLCYMFVLDVLDQVAIHNALSLTTRRNRVVSSNASHQIIDVTQCNAWPTWGASLVGLYFTCDWALSVWFPTELCSKCCRDSNELFSHLSRLLRQWIVVGKRSIRRRSIPVASSRLGLEPCESERHRHKASIAE